MGRAQSGISPAGAGFWNNLMIALILFWLINFIAFIGITSYLGGDALNGKIEDAHYYLGSHGHYTQVGQHTFVFSRIYTIFTIVLHLVLMGYGAISAIKDRRNKSGSPGK